MPPVHFDSLENTYVFTDIDSGSIQNWDTASTVFSSTQLEFNTFADSIPVSDLVQPAVLSVSRPVSWSPVQYANQLGSSSYSASYAHIYDVVWATRVPNFMQARIPLPNNPLNISAWRQYLAGYHDSEICDFIEFGWPIGYCSPVWPTCVNRNHPSSLAYPEDVQRYLHTELQHGALLGPFDILPCEPGHVSPLMTRPKKHSESRRVIVDLSWPPWASVNAGIPRDYYLGVPYKLTLPTVDDFVAMILHAGQDCLMYRLDVQRAFRQLRSDVLDHPLLCIQFDNKYYIDVAIPFGLRTGTYFTQRVTNAVRYLMKTNFGWEILNYIDDLVSAAVADQAMASFTELRSLLRDLGLPEAPNKVDDPSCVQEFLGVIFDSHNLTMRMPEDKIHDALQLAQVWESKKSATKRELQSLIGKFAHIAKCVRPARLFINRMLAALRAAPEHGVIHLDLDFQRDAAWFRQFLPSYNGINLLAYPLLPDNEVVYLDSCLTGVGAIYKSEFYSMRLPEFILQENHHITRLEMLNIVVATKLWRNQWRHSTVRIYCDNEACVSVINTGRARDPFLLRCARDIWLVSATYDFIIISTHVSSSENVFADLLSRRHMDKFRVRCNDMLQKSDLVEIVPDARLFKLIECI